MASETIVAVFRTAADAETVAAELRQSGINPAAIEQHTSQYGQTGADATLARPEEGKRSGLWGWLLGEESYQDDHTAYERTMTSGGVVLSVVVSDAEASRVVAIIERHHPIDIDEKTSATQATSETGYAGATAAAGAATARPAPAATTATAGAAGQVISLAEESLQVGKRQVEAGTAKIRRYVVERPVEEQIRLRTESLRVERRPVSGDAKVAADAFTDKVVEVRQTGEEAVVGKTARVVEEVVIGKDVNERVETVRDTVRREEIDVTGVGKSGAAAATNPAATGTPPTGTPPTGTSAAAPVGRPSGAPAAATPLPAATQAPATPR